MRTVVMLCDLLHLVMVLCCGGPLLALSLSLLDTGVPTSILLAFSVLPLLATMVAVQVFDMQLIGQLPKLERRWLWRMGLLCVPLLVGPLFWWRGRQWLLKGARQPVTLLQGGTQKITPKGTVWEKLDPEAEQQTTLVPRPRLRPRAVSSTMVEDLPESLRR